MVDGACSRKHTPKRILHETTEKPVSEAYVQQWFQKQFLQLFYEDEEFREQVLRCLLTVDSDEASIEAKKPRRTWFDALKLVEEGATEHELVCEMPKIEDAQSADNTLGDSSAKAGLGLGQTKSSTIALFEHAGGCPAIELHLQPGKTRMCEATQKTMGIRTDHDTSPPPVDVFTGGHLGDLPCSPGLQPLRHSQWVHPPGHPFNFESAPPELDVGDVCGIQSWKANPLYVVSNVNVDSDSSHTWQLENSSVSCVDDLETPLENIRVSKGVQVIKSISKQEDPEPRPPLKVVESNNLSEFMENHHEAPAGAEHPFTPFLFTRGHQTMVRNETKVALAVPATQDSDNLEKKAILAPLALETEQSQSTCLPDFDLSTKLSNVSASTSTTVPNHASDGRKFLSVGTSTDECVKQEVIAFEPTTVKVSVSRMVSFTFVEDDGTMISQPVSRPFSDRRAMSEALVENTRQDPKCIITLRSMKRGKPFLEIDCLETKTADKTFIPDVNLPKISLSPQSGSIIRTSFDRPQAASEESEGTHTADPPSASPAAHPDCKPHHDIGTITSPVCNTGMWGEYRRDNAFVLSKNESPQEQIYIVLPSKCFLEIARTEGTKAPLNDGFGQDYVVIQHAKVCGVSTEFIYQKDSLSQNEFPQRPPSGTRSSEVAPMPLSTSATDIGEENIRVALQQKPSMSETSGGNAADDDKEQDRRKLSSIETSPLRRIARKGFRPSPEIQWLPPKLKPMNAIVGEGFNNRARTHDHAG